MWYSQVLTKLGFAQEEDRAPGRQRGARRNLYSGISAGTELTAFAAATPICASSGTRRSGSLFPSEETTLHYPVVGWGYEECGKVVELGRT